MPAFLARASSEFVGTDTLEEAGGGGGAL